MLLSWPREDKEDVSCVLLGMYVSGSYLASELWVSFAIFPVSVEALLCHLCPFGVNPFLNRSAVTHLLLLSSLFAKVFLCLECQELQDDAQRSTAQQMEAILRCSSECLCTGTVCVSKQGNLDFKQTTISYYRAREIVKINIFY